MNINDRVICIDAKGVDGDLVEGDIYPVCATSECPGCHTKTIDVGVPLDAGSGLGGVLRISVSVCGKCGAQEFADRRWFRATRFATVDEGQIEELMEEVNELLKPQEVEV